MDAQVLATAEALSTLGVANAYVDGEVCALRADGTTSFSAVQAASDYRRSAELVSFAFDLLFLNGKNVAERPLVERKTRLEELLEGAAPSIRYSDHVVGEGPRFHEAACKLHAEGIVSKRMDAPYKPGDRRLWRKTKCFNREEFIVVGYTDPEGSRPYIGALLLAYYDEDGRLVYAGRAGGGMSRAVLKRLHETLAASRPISARERRTRSKRNAVCSTSR